MSNRRDFFKKSLAGAAALTLPAIVANEAYGRSPSVHDGSIKIGYQLWPLRTQLLRDPESVFKLLKSNGVEGVEYSGMESIPAITYRLLQNKYNLPCCGIHHGLTQWETEGTVPRMEYSYILGNSDLSCHWLDPHQRGSLENYLSHSRFFNKIAAEVKANGFKFYYHNHAFEYTDVFGGKYAMDIMLENTDPALFHMQFHIAGLPASINLPRYTENLGGRLLSIHLPVLDRNGDLNPAVSQDLIDAAKKSGSCKWFIIEQGAPPDLAEGAASIARTVDILRKMIFK